MKVDLQRLILERINELTDEADKLTVTLSVKITTASDKLNATKDVYPINGKLREIRNWITAMIEEKRRLTPDNMKGPSTVLIPSATHQSCFGCEYHDHYLVKSGNNPIYANNCTHTDALKQGYLYGNIGSKDYTPKWCPIIYPKESNNSKSE